MAEHIAKRLGSDEEELLSALIVSMADAVYAVVGKPAPGVLAVLGVAGLVSGDRAGSAIATPATGPASASDPSAGRRLRP